MKIFQNGVSVVAEKKVPFNLIGNTICDYAMCKFHLSSMMLKVADSSYIVNLDVGFDLI